MKIGLNQFKTYLKTREKLNWFLFVLGLVVLSVEVDAYRLHNDVGPTGGHHGDVAGGLLLLGFEFCLSGVLFIGAITISFLFRSRIPVIGTTLALIAALPTSFMLALMAALISYVCMPIAVAFTPTAAIILIIIGIRVKPRKEQKDQLV